MFYNKTTFVLGQSLQLYEIFKDYELFYSVEAIFNSIINILLHQLLNMLICLTCMHSLLQMFKKSVYAAKNVHQTGRQLHSLFHLVARFGTV